MDCRTTLQRGARLGKKLSWKPAALSGSCGRVLLADEDHARLALPQFTAICRVEARRLAYATRALDFRAIAPRRSLAAVRRSGLILSGLAERILDDAAA